MFPNYRLMFRHGRHRRLQQWLDWLLRARAVRCL
jgi:hypothetical protein